ncbi:MAG: Dyp-type peroxidase [Candidatus Sulfotelmatobacter sp.]
MAGCELELDDIQAGVLRPRPTPYAATYVIFRIDERGAGRDLICRLSGVVASAADPTNAGRDTWVSVALSFHGLRALGVPQESLDTFSPEFQQGMANRAKVLRDDGESGPERWEKPLGWRDVHVVMVAVAPSKEHLERSLRRARAVYEGLHGVTAIWRQDCHALPGDREAFGFRDGISHPAIEGSGIPGTNPDERPLKAGEFVLGYPDEMGETPFVPQPDVLGRNGSYVAFRKLHQRVAAFRQYLKANSTTSEQEEWIAAKMMGRWRSGAPLALCPLHDNPGLGADPHRNNGFLFKQEDPIGYRTPCGSHIRRMNPRDGDVAGVVRIHRMIRRGASYGPLLPDGVLEDDGLDRGLMFAFVGAHLGRQFEFVQSEWMNDASFFGGPAGDADPAARSLEGAGTFDIPNRPLRVRLRGLPNFVVNRGGEYCFLPGLRALRWLGNLNT